jgi:hypothetical protein
MGDNTTDFSSRVLCSDVTCIGVIGADGKCKECGKPSGHVKDTVAGNKNITKIKNIISPMTVDEKDFVCKTCGFIAFGDDPSVAKYHKCLGCGNIMGEEPIKQNTSLSSDGLLETCQNCKYQFSTRASVCPKCNHERTLECFVCKNQIAKSSTSCPECGDPTPFEIAQKAPKQEAVHIVNQGDRNIYRRAYEWPMVLNWTLSLFLFGLTIQRQSYGAGRVYLGSLVGITLAIPGGLIVAIWKYFKRSPAKEITKKIETKKATDKALFNMALMIAIFLIGKSIYFEAYASLIDAAILLGLGFGVRANLHLARWLYAIYAFVTPIIVIGTDSGNAVVWPFVFYCACRSLYSQKTGVNGCGN